MCCVDVISLKDDVSDSGSAPKTPQDVTSLSSMPLTVHMSTLETPPPGTIAEETVDHPLSPTQDQASDTIVRIDLCADFFFFVFIQSFVLINHKFIDIHTAFEVLVELRQFIIANSDRESECVGIDNGCKTWNLLNRH